MRRILALVCVAVACVAAASAAPPAGRFVVVFAKPRNADERILVTLLKAAKLDYVFGELSKSFVLPRNVTIRVQGGEEGPYYNPATRTIVLNHGFSALALNVFTAEYPKITGYRLGQLFASLEYFVLFHELGHALIDVWELPVIGREEDGADAFSTIFMTEFVPNGGEIALAGADFFNFLGRQQELNELDFADEHSLNLQRVYSIVCWVYGSNPAKWQSLTSILPERRGVRCPSEYQQLKKAWFKLLKPHVRTR